MAKRSITDPEIGLIKALLARGMKNKDIQFFFNRPDRPVNSGRITQIRDGSYGPEVTKATDAELDAFCHTHKPKGQIAAVSVPSVVESNAHDSAPKGPLDPSTISAFFAKDAKGVWRLTVGETDQHECKAGFGLRSWGEWVRAVAALANNRGGWIFFGIHDKDATATVEDDKSYAAVGLKGDAFQKCDPAEISRIVKGALDPTPTVNTTHLTIGTATIGVMRVEQHPSRPVIVRNADGSTLREGDILFRYPGRSDRIKYSDLRAILDERDAVARKNVLPLIDRLLSLGPERALIADLDSGVLVDGNRPIVIDPALIEQIKFIREGEFDEKAGAPTLRLVGDVTADGKAVETKIVRENITSDAVLRNFLVGEKVSAPMQYLVHSAHSNREWQPIWFYLKQAGVAVADAIGRLEKEQASRPAHQKTAIARLKGKTTAYNLSAGKPKHLVAAFASGKLEEPKDDSEAHKFALAVQGLPDNQERLDTFRALLLKCLDRATSQSSAHKNLLSAVFRAACRLDELIYKPR